MTFSVEISEAKFNDTKVGWVNEPDGREAMSILVSCLSSLFLSSWAVMHLPFQQRPNPRLDVWLHTSTGVYTAYSVLSW